MKAAVFQPLYLLDLEIYYHHGREIHRLKEARIALPFSSIPFDIRKSSQVIFLSEILYKCLQEAEANPEMFKFIFHAINYLDQANQGFSNFHLWFLLKLTGYLGIAPSDENASICNFFDLQKGQFVSHEPGHLHYTNKYDTLLFTRLLATDSTTLDQLEYTQNERKNLTEILMKYYKIHFDLLGEIKSLPILQEVMK